MTDKLGIDDALRLLREVVAEKGSDYEYPEEEMREYENELQCVYKNAEGGPSCIVGHVADKIGVLDEVAEFVGAVSTMEQWFTWDAAYVLQTAQTEQDHHKTWGEALKKAEVRAVQRR